jgi:hypothetical protein
MRTIQSKIMSKKAKTKQLTKAAKYLKSKYVVDTWTEEEINGATMLIVELLSKV